MTRIQRLQPAVKHAGEKERSALQRVARSQAALELERQRLAQLRRYKVEYLERRGGVQAVVSPVELQDFHRFIEQLDRTIEGQLERVAQHERDVELKRRLWQASRLDSKKVQQVVENLEQEASREERRRDQKLQDEFAQRSRKSS